MSKKKRGKCFQKVHKNAEDCCSYRGAAVVQVCTCNIFGFLSRKLFLLSFLIVIFFTAKRFPIVRHELRILISVRKQNIFCLGVFEAVKRGGLAVRRAAEQFLQSARLPPILLHSSSSGYHENNTDKATHSLRALSEFAPLLHDELIESVFFHSVFPCWAVFYKKKKRERTRTQLEKKNV